MSEKDQNNIKEDSSQNSEEDDTKIQEVMENLNPILRQDSIINKRNEDTYPREREITELYKDLKKDIDTLSITIKNILDTHDKDYSSTFSVFMDKVRKDLKYRVEKIKKIQLEKEKLNDVEKIKAERDVFKQDALRLKETCQKLKLKIEELSRKTILFSEQLTLINGRLLESEIANKQIYKELSKSLQSQQEIMKELNETKEMLIQNEEEKNCENNLTLEETERDKYISQIERLKNELKREKAKYQMRENELNKEVFEDDKLKKIFMDCVDEVKKMIFKRKAMSVLICNEKKKNEIGKMNIDYKHFLTKDKLEVLEKFLFNEEVNQLLREALFEKKEQYKRKLDANKRRLNNLRLPGIQSDSKEKLYITTNNFRNKKFKGIPENLLISDKKGDPFFYTMTRFNTMSNLSTKSNEETIISKRIHK